MAAYVFSSITQNTNSGNKVVTFTPGAGELVVIAAFNSNQTATPTVSDNNADGLGTYTTAVTAVFDTSVDFGGLFVRDALLGSGTSTAFTMAPGTTTGGGLVVITISGMSKAGADAIRQVGSQDNQAGFTTPAPAFPAAALTENMCVGMIVANSATPSETPPASWTERHDTGYGTPATGIEVVTRDSGFTGTTVTWGGVSNTLYCSLVLELDTSAAALGLPSLVMAPPIAA